MIVGSALGFPVPTPSMQRSDAPKSAEDTSAPKSREQSAQFAAFLSLIVANDPKLRSDLQKQLPAESVGLLDRLLSSTAETFSDPPSTVDRDPMPDMPSAIDAARYGMLTDGTRALRNAFATTATTTTPSTSTTTTTPPATTTDRQLTRSDINAINRARAFEVLGSLQNGEVSEADGVNTANAQSRISQSVLARVTARKSPSLEELLAIGDREAASVRAGIDQVLAKSGTEEGLLLAASHAANAALTAALAASANDVTKPIRDVEALDPELRGRLERVVERMKSAYGHDVTVVETARSQERQDSLFAQGRTTPGSVVTWTQDSLHTLGEAVDVIVDGSWDNPKGFARLQEIAKEEGLGTLGLKDPGHLELPKGSWTTNADVRVTSAMSNVQSSNGIARVATVARVAQVGAGMSVGVTLPEFPAVPQPTVQTNGAAGLLPQQREASGSANSQTSSGSLSDSSSRKSSLKTSDTIDARAAGQAYQQTPTDTKTTFIGPVDETLRPSGASAADAVDRVHDINAMREQSGAKPLSHMTLEVDNADGTKQQITVDVRGNTVGTHISADSTSADRMRANANELRTGLENRGLEADHLRFSAQGARDKSSTPRDWDNRQASRDEQRAQNRDAQGRGSGNQDRQRPQNQEKQ